MNQDVLAGSQPTVSLGAVLEGVAERLQGRFTALVHDLPAQTAESRWAARIWICLPSSCSLHHNTKLYACAMHHATTAPVHTSQLVACCQDQVCISSNTQLMLIVAIV